MKVAVIFCTWARKENFAATLDSLARQTWKGFKVYIWNNNILEKDFFDKHVALYDVVSILRPIKSYECLNIKIIHSESNIGGVGRFKLACDLAYEFDKLIFVDDDQTLPPDMISRFLNAHEQKSIYSWWAWKIDGDSYWSKRERVVAKDADYCGTGGMIIDSDIFRDPEVLEIPEQYKFMEDIWLSFFAKYKHGYKLRGIEIDIKNIEDQKNQWPNLVKQKDEFYKYLIEKYKVKKDKT